jgi:hypothetical protein
MAHQTVDSEPLEVPDHLVGHIEQVVLPLDARQVVLPPSQALRQIGQADPIGPGAGGMEKGSAVAVDRPHDLILQRHDLDRMRGPRVEPHVHGPPPAAENPGDVGVPAPFPQPAAILGGMVDGLDRSVEAGNVSPSGEDSDMLRNHVYPLGFTLLLNTID